MLTKVIVRIEDRLQEVIEDYADSLPLSSERVARIGSLFDLLDELEDIKIKLKEEEEAEEDSTPRYVKRVRYFGPTEREKQKPPL